MRFAAGRSNVRSLGSLHYLLASADLDLAVRDEFVGRHGQIGRRWPLPDAARAVILRAVTRAEEAVVIALMRQRDAAEMGADADQDQPLVMALFHPRLIGLRIRQRSDVDFARLINFFFGAVADE